MKVNFSFSLFYTSCLLLILKQQCSLVCLILYNALNFEKFSLDFEDTKNEFHFIKDFKWINRSVCFDFKHSVLKVIVIYGSVIFKQ